MQLRHGHYTTAHPILHMPLSHRESINDQFTLGAPLLILDLALCQRQSMHKIWRTLANHCRRDDTYMPYLTMLKSGTLILDPHPESDRHQNLTTSKG